MHVTSRKTQIMFHEKKIKEEILTTLGTFINRIEHKTSQQKPKSNVSNKLNTSC